MVRIFDGLCVFRRDGEELSDAEVNSTASGILCKDPSLAVQSQAEEADINTIVRRFGITGKLPEGVRVPTFADYEDVFDFQTAQNAIALANQSFMAMPADIRARFGHDPQRFVEFCSDEANLPEMRKLGLAVEPVVVPKPEPMEVRVVSDPVPVPKP